MPPFSPPCSRQRLHFPEAPARRLGDGFSRAPPRGAHRRGSSSRRPSRQVPGVRTVRDGQGWFRRCVRGRDPGGGPHRPRPFRRRAPGVPATGCAAARLSRPRRQNCAVSMRIRRWPWISTPMLKSYLMPGDELSLSTTFYKMLRNG
ncbi:SNARE-associated protein Snapin isoform X1 [Lemur catta]|uniref:SNARE-associated protein Snapin isoform X1 n=1 Tax=Lemur catta TaxID=9447 RepID=UPI001E26821A|nr:SNARE-associated protein Snapin isoform X1 [Lemur catta]